MHADSILSLALSKTITTKYFGQTDRLITVRTKLALLIDITDHRINLLYDTVSSPQRSMHTGAKSIDRFINRVTLVRSTFVVRAERERERESTAIRSRPREISTHAANSSWWTCHAWSVVVYEFRYDRGINGCIDVYLTRVHITWCTYVKVFSSLRTIHTPGVRKGRGGGWERTRWKSHGNTAVSYGGSRGRRRDASIRASDKERNRVLLVHGGGQNIDLWGGLRGWCPRALHPRPPTLLILLLCLTRVPGWQPNQ